MRTLRSHTHLQATQANTQAKACKRVCLPNRTKTVQTRHERPLTERRAATNKMFLQWCRDELAESFIFVQRLVSWDRTRLRKGTTAET
jgi:hypothetical protein